MMMMRGNHEPAGKMNPLLFLASVFKVATAASVVVRLIQRHYFSTHTHQSQCLHTVTWLRRIPEFKYTYTRYFVILILGKVSYENMAVAVCNRALHENDYGLHNRDASTRVLVLLYHHLWDSLLCIDDGSLPLIKVLRSAAIKQAWSLNSKPTMWQM